MSRLGKKLIKAALQGRSIARGEADVATYEKFVPQNVEVEQHIPTQVP